MQKKSHRVWGFPSAADTRSMPAQHATHDLNLATLNHADKQQSCLGDSINIWRDLSQTNWKFSRHKTDFSRQISDSTDVMTSSNVCHQWECSRWKLHLRKFKAINLEVRQSHAKTNLSFDVLIAKIVVLSPQKCAEVRRFRIEAEKEANLTSNNLFLFC